VPVAQEAEAIIETVVPKTKEVEVRLERTEQQLRLFQKISRFMVREMSLQEVLQGVVSLVVEYTQCDSCLVYLADGEDLVLCASNTPHPSTIGKVRMRRKEGLTGWVASERRLVAISREAYKDPRFKKFGELPEDTYEAFLSSPVIARNRVVGAGAGAHVAGRGGFGQPCGPGAFLRPDFNETIGT
jgi:uroporphyrinogen-III synthase